jgi:hypothetical protein
MILVNIELRQKYFVHVLWHHEISEEDQYVKHHRKVIDPLDNYSNEEQKVKDFCSAVFTLQLIEEYKEFFAKEAA